MKLLEGKVAVITGSGGGLGRAHALAFAREGAKVVINDPGVSRDGTGGTAKMADSVVEEIRKLGGEAAANYDSVATTEGAENLIRTAVEKFGRVDILVNNAGILRDKTIHNMTDEMWDLVLAVHLRGTFACTRAAARVMKEKGTGGRIVNTTSVAGLKGNFGQSNYGAAKAGIYGFTMTAALELAKDGISVNCIAPLAKTRMTEDVESVPTEFRPEDVSQVVLFLASDLAKDVTGKIIGVHGRHLFEYRMEITPGQEKKEAWTPKEISDWIHAPEEAPKPAAAAPAGGSRVAALFRALPGGFDAEKSAGWESTMHFQVAGAGDWTVEVKEKILRVAEGKPASPTCVITVDAETLLGMAEGKVKGDMAFMQGKLKATQVKDLAKFGKVFDFKKVAAAPAAPTPAPAAGGPIAAMFKALPLGFDAERAAGWSAVIHFAVPGAGDWTIEVKEKTLRVADGKPASPTSTITIGAETLLGMIEGKVNGQMAFLAGKIKATNMGDLAKFGKVFDFKKMKAAAPQAPAGAPAADLAPLLKRLPEQFLPDKAAGFNGSIAFKADGHEAAVEIKDRTCVVRPSVPNPTCVVTTDAATLAGILQGTVDAQKAFGEGKVKITHPPSWLKFKQLFKFEAAPPARGLNRALIGKRYLGAAALVRPERIAAYDEAVRDKGSLVFPVSLIKELFLKFFDDPDFNGDVSRMVHGEQVMTFHRPLRAWDLVSPRGVVLGIEDKSSGQILAFGQRIYCEGELLVEMESRLFFRGESRGEKSAAPAPPPARGTPSSTDLVEVAADLPYRYAAASGDNNPIHVDPAFAQSVGFKGVILQGLCTFALAARTLPKDLERLQARFAKPVYPGDKLTTSFWGKGNQVEFETTNPAGEVVLANGLAVLRA